MEMQRAKFGIVADDVQGRIPLKVNERTEAQLALLNFGSFGFNIRN